MILDSDFKHKGSFITKIMIYIQTTMPLVLIHSCYSVIETEDDEVEILMNFVGLITIAEIPNWYGYFFEMLLDAFIPNKTTRSDDYLQFETDTVSKVSCTILYLIFT